MYSTWRLGWGTIYTQVVQCASDIGRNLTAPLQVVLWAANRAFSPDYGCYLKEKNS
jgi:hypothetical protein